MIAYFRKFLGAVQALADGVFSICERLEAVQQSIPTDDVLRERVEALERSRATWEAEMEAALMRAESKFKAARAAEERARGKEERAKKAEEAAQGDEEGLEDVPEWYLDLVREGNGGGGPQGGVQPVREDVESYQPNPGRPSDRARLSKWGG